MSKQLIYTDITKVLYMMKNHGVRFQIWGGANWIDCCPVSDFYHLMEAGTHFDEVFYAVHPEDMAKFQKLDGDFCRFSYKIYHEKAIETVFCEKHLPYDKRNCREMTFVKILERRQSMACA